MQVFSKFQAKNKPGKKPQPAPEQTTAEQVAGDIALRDAVIRGWFNSDTGELFKDFAVGPEDIVADIGCGDGGNAAFCARRGASIILADIDPATLERAAARVAAEPNHRGYKVHQTTSDPLPIADGAATKVVCTEVIEHVDSPARLLAELARIGRPGAQYLLSCPDAKSEELQKRVAPSVYFEKPNHIRILQPEEFARYVEDAGLVIEARHTHGFYALMWWTLYWATDGSRDHPLIQSWTRTWQHLLDLPKGHMIKGALDDLLPKSQVIIARKI